MFDLNIVILEFSWCTFILKYFSIWFICFVLWIYLRFSKVNSFITVSKYNYNAPHLKKFLKSNNKAYVSMLAIFYPFPWYFQTKNLNLEWGGSSWIIFFSIYPFSSFRVSFSICFIHLLIWEYKNVSLLRSEALTILFSTISTAPKIQWCLVLVGVQYMCRNEWWPNLTGWFLAPWFVCTVDLPLIDSLIRVLQNMEHCQKKPENSTESNTEETKKSDLTQDDFHLKILKDISCEFLSNIFQVLTKVGEKHKMLSSAKESMDCFLLSNFIVNVFIF